MTAAPATTLTVEEEYTLVRLAQEGDEQAFRALAESYWRFVAAVSVRMVRRWSGPHLKNAPDLVEDVVQVAFIQLWKFLMRPDFSLESRIEFLLLRIIYVQSRSLVQQYFRASTYQDRLLGLYLDEAPTEREEDAEVLVVEREARRTIQQAVLQLPEKYQTVTRLRYWNDLTIEACAHALSISRADAAMRLHMARLALRAVLLKADLDVTADQLPRERLKLTPAQVQEIRVSPDSNYVLAKRYGITAGYAGKVKRGLYPLPPEQRRRKGKVHATTP